MVAIRQANDEDAFFKKMRCELDAEGFDINTPYPLGHYLRDLEAITKAAGLPAAETSVVWREPENGQTHVASCSSNHLYMRTYQHLMDKYGTKIGGGRGLRACALIAFFNRCRERLDATELNWLDRKRGDFDRKFTLLKFLLDYPVPLDKQFSPEAIPASAIDEFLAVMPAK
jgi:hypothetical protein